MATVRLTNGRDVYTTKQGDELVLARDGNDRITIKGFFLDPETDQTRITVNGGRGNDRIISEVVVSGQVGIGGPGDDRIEIQGGDDVGGQAFGNAGNDILICIGSEEGCLLDGGAGQDQLISQVDTVAFLDGGPGRDRFTGGPLSNDSYAFSQGDTVSGAQRDVISGFRRNQDEIDLSAIDANTNAPGNQAFSFVASTNNPDIGEVSFFRSGTSTIVVGDTGSTTFQIELQNFDEPLLGTDFDL